MKHSLAAGLLIVAGCGEVSVEIEREFTGHTLITPAAAGSTSPRLSAGADGRLRLCWLEPAGEGAHALRFAVYEAKGWSRARTIATGDDWFVNWADVPTLTALADGTLVATWLGMLGESTYAYGVYFAISGDAGASWSAARLLHEHRSPAEHGFVSLAALDGESLRAVWLDGRATGGGHDDAHGAGAGAMQLYTRTLSRTGALGPEQVLDTRVCDCCPTSLVVLADGASLVAYRDRGDDELRDLGVARIELDGSVTTTALHHDGWVIDGCPVNGPVLALRGDLVAGVWFTLGRDETSRVRAAFSRDGGRSFGEPVELASGGVVGCLSACFDETGNLWVSWLQSGPFEDVPRADAAAAALGGAWNLVAVDPERAVRGPARRVLYALPARISGIARLAPREGSLLFASTWANEAGETRVGTARIPPESLQLALEDQAPDAERDLHD